LNNIKTTHGDITLPAFFPDGTKGFVRTLDSIDLKNSHVKGLVVNVLHLSLKPGISTISQLGGIHKYMGWQGPILSDSGGFQIFSLIDKSPGMGTVTPNGFIYKMDKEKGKKKLTPEKCIQKQFQMKSDIIFCLDYCTHPDWDKELQIKSVEYTVDWARRCRREFDLQMSMNKSGKYKPLLFAVVQGGSDPELRRICAESLLEVGFDGYGYGGWPISSKGELVEMVGYVSELIPDTFYKHALGIGKPENILNAFHLGYHLFDCTIPTRDARRGRLCVAMDKLKNISLQNSKFYKYLYIRDKKHIRDERPVDESCDCLCCNNYSRAYLFHLFRSDEGLAYRLATIHNLRFYTRLMNELQLKSKELKSAYE